MAGYNGFHVICGILSPRWVTLPSLLLLLGCQGEPPPAIETHAVRGTVQFNNGDLLSSGFIEFKSKRDQRISMSANIEKDGSFKLNTLHEQQNMAGGVEGPCSAMVTVFRPGNPIPLIIDVKRTFEVQPGKENVFAIKLKI